MAEMSGRKRRMVKQPNGSYKYCLRSSEAVPLEKVCCCAACVEPDWLVKACKAVPVGAFKHRCWCWIQLPAS